VKIATRLQEAGHSDTLLIVTGGLINDHQRRRRSGFSPTRLESPLRQANDWRSTWIRYRPPIVSTGFRPPALADTCRTANPPPPTKTHACSLGFDTGGS
jgi:hypothetical protein